MESSNKKLSIYTVIRGTGSYIPTEIIANNNFLKNVFYDNDGTKWDKTNEEIVDKFLKITTIAERRYVSEDLVTSDIAFFAAEKAINSSGINKEELDYIIVAHNFGDVQTDNRRSELVPNLAARVKHKLGIENPNTIAYDIPFGCPGWLQGVIQADYYIRSGDAKKILVIGAETLSRVCDPHDRDSMIYADGAGAVILEAFESSEPVGILAHKTRSDTFVYSKMLHMGKSYHEDSITKDQLYLKMNGRKLYQYALETVPGTVKACLDKCEIDLSQVDKVLIHQANAKMDDAILRNLFALYGKSDIPENIMPMTIELLGNSSVATVPTLLDLILNGQLPPHKIAKDDICVFASVGAGMNINVMVYKTI